MDPDEPGTILIVEDNPSDVYLIEAALAEHRIHHRLQIVNNGEAAIEFLQRAVRPDSDIARPDLILLDQSLPRRSGREVLDALQRLDPARLMRVIVMSSIDSQISACESAQSNVDGYFTKPSSLDEFMTLGRLVRTILLEAPKK